MSARRFRKKAKSSRRSYSYSPSSSLRDEEIAAYRKFAAAILLVVLFSAGLYLWGVEAVAGLGSFWSRFFPNSQNVVVGDPSPTTETTLLAPNLDPLPLQTNNPDEVKVKGWARSGREVKIYLNDEAVGEILVGKDGRFSYNNFTLTEGKNTLYATTLVNGNESKPSDSQEVIYDKTKPDLEVSMGEVDTEEGTVRITGSTEPQATVTVNKHRAIVNLQGKFNYLVSNLKEGENQLKIVALDEAGNETVIEKTVTYESESSSEEVTPTPS